MWQLYVLLLLLVDGRLFYFSSFVCSSSLAAFVSVEKMILSKCVWNAERAPLAVSKLV